MPVDLILGADSISAPLTGIGRYAFELARALPACPDIARVRYFALGRWAQWQALQHADGATPAARSLRSVLAANPAAVHAYRLLMPALQRLRLRGQRHCIFHAPDYFVPPFPGPTVATVHDMSHLICPQLHPAARIAYMRRALPASLRRTSHVITVSEATRRDLVAHLGYPAERITVTHLGASAAFRPHSPAELAPALQRLGLRPQGYSLYVGTIEPRKNLDRLLTAYESLPPPLRLRHPLVLAGSPGWNSEHTHQRMERAASAGWLRYLRYAPQGDLPALYAGARVFVYPSLYEGFGLPVLEAMACGVPVITSDCSSLPEVAGGAALQVAPLDEAALAAALQRALQDDAWRAQASAAGLARARQFSWQRCVRQTAEVYARLAASSGA